MDKMNSIKRATSIDIEENKKKIIKSFRAEIYDHLDKKKENAFSHYRGDAKDKQIKSNDDEKTQKR